MIATIHDTDTRRANGAGQAVAIAATRYGLGPQQAAQCARTARAMVARGFSAGRTVAAVRRMAKKAISKGSA
jgi:hypothetical protein